VKHILQDYLTADFTNVGNSWAVDDAIIQKVEYVAALRSKALDYAREVMCTIRKSNKRCEAFKEIIVRGNKKIGSRMMKAIPSSSQSLNFCWMKPHDGIQSTLC
jgi:hypothetical protein